MRQTWVAPLSAMLGLALFADSASVATGAESPSLDDTSWVLSSLPGRTLLPKRTPTARFAGGQVQGGDSCNHYRTPYSTTGSSLTVGPGLTFTLIFCTQPEVQQQVAAFRSALFGARSYRVRDGQLQLLAADGSVLAAFVAQPTSLPGTSWRALFIIKAGGGMPRMVANSTMDFAADGKVTGSGGCNTYTSSYEAHGDKLRFTPAAATRKVCDAPGVMEQEQAFFNALEAVATRGMEADRLDMRTEEGVPVLTLVRSDGP